MIWAVAVFALGIAFIGLVLFPSDRNRQTLKSDPKSVISWKAISRVIFREDPFPLDGLQYILLGFVFVAIGAVGVLLNVIDFLL